MKQTNKKQTRKYDLGSYVKPISAASNFVGGAIGGDTGGFISSAGSGVAAGLAIGGPLGAIGGGLLGGVSSLIGGAKRRKAERAAEKQNYDIYAKDYANNIEGNMDIYNENPYGAQIFAKGGEVEVPKINIEKGELQIDPTSGKILREYNKINPETGGLYEEHSDGKDTKNNFVSAEPGTFIVTKSKANLYKNAIDNNDTLARNTILQNIKNAKNNVANAKKMALGSYVLPNLSQPTPSVAGSYNGIPAPNRLPLFGNSPVQASQTTGAAQTGLLGNITNALGNYGVPAANIAQGLFGKVERQPYGQRINNPYQRQILGNMPQDVSLNPLVNRINRNQATQFSQIDQTTSSSPIARANKNNVFANTQNQLSDVYMQQQQMNNQVRGQRANIYSGLANQDMQESQRLQGYNFGVDQLNAQNRGAKSNLLSTGLSQLQQSYQNQNTIGQQKANDALRNKLLYEMFPNLRFYQETFGGK